jgi:uncharacterized protein (TIGR03083 family)
MTAEARTVIAALRRSHEKLVALAGPLSPDEVRAPSYASEWTIAQVLSHLGSGAVISTLSLAAAVGGRPSPEQEEYLAIWDVWNAKSPDAQAADGLDADRALVEALEALSDDELDALTVPFAGLTLDAPTYVRMRLSEHAVHSWDIAVARDPSAVLDPVATEQITDRMLVLSGWVGKPSGEEIRVQITTTEPARTFLLSATDEVVLEPGADASVPQVELPAEAFVRLVCGRLDPAHTPKVTVGAEHLESLRSIYPGF